MKNTIFVVIGLAIVLGLGMTFPKSNPVIPNPLGGAVSGSDNSSPTVSINNVRRWYYSGGFTLSSATTTPCSYTVQATSTLIIATVQVTTGTTTASTWRIATSTTPFATTTNLTSLGLAANTTGEVSFIGTAGTVLAPGTALVWGVQGNSAGGQNYGVGTCKAILQDF